MKGGMQLEAISQRIEAVRARPVAELLECPEEIGQMLNGSSQCIPFVAGETIFRQAGVSRGIYLVVSGLLQRRAERLETRVTLAPARVGDLVELAASLGDGRHTYTLTAQSAGSVLLLPKAALDEAFQRYTPFRMRLLEELAREVSRAYSTTCLCRTATHRRASAAD